MNQARETNHSGIEALFLAVIPPLFVLLTAWANAWAMVGASAVGLLAWFVIFHGGAGKRALWAAILGVGTGVAAAAMIALAHG